MDTFALTQFKVVTLDYKIMGHNSTTIYVLKCKIPFEFFVRYRLLLQRVSFAHATVTLQAVVPRLEVCLGAGTAPPGCPISFELFIL